MKAWQNGGESEEICVEQGGDEREYENRKIIDRWCQGKIRLCGTVFRRTNGELLPCEMKRLHRILLHVEKRAIYRFYDDKIEIPNSKVCLFFP